jgi:hypothetical protein
MFFCLRQTVLTEGKPFKVEFPGAIEREATLGGRQRSGRDCTLSGSSRFRRLLERVLQDHLRGFLADHY